LALPLLWELIKKHMQKKSSFDATPCKTLFIKHTLDLENVQRNMKKEKQRGNYRTVKVSSK
jgi:hypothetical protein